MATTAEGAAAKAAKGAAAAKHAPQDVFIHGRRPKPAARPPEAAAAAAKAGAAKAGAAAAKAFEELCEDVLWRARVEAAAPAKACIGTCLKSG